MRAAGPVHDDHDADAPPADVDLTVVVPVFDEAPALPELFRRLGAALEEVRDGLGLSAEIVAIDDGSRDGGGAVLDALAAGDPSVRVFHQENRGQHEAVLAGFARSRGRLVVSIDADLQNPPEEIPRIVAALGEGHDLVAARRVRRQDSLSRRVASRLANLTSASLARLYTRVPLHDIGCMLRGYSRELVAAMLRAAKEPGAPPPFVPALALRFARSPLEIDVDHSPRAHGRSRYGWLGLIDLHLRLVQTLARHRPR